MDSTPAYVQSIRPAKLGCLLTAVAVAFGLAGSINNFAGGSWYLTGFLALFMILFAALATAFWELRIEINDGEVHVGWARPFRSTVPLVEIETLGVEPYPVRRFTGWGARWAPGGDLAYSDVSVPEALVIKRLNGRSVYITLRDPAAALQPISDAKAAWTTPTGPGPESPPPADPSASPAA